MTHNNLEQPTILLIDDNTKNLQVALNILHQEGYNLLFAHDGEKGFDLAIKNLPNLILLDILMPGLDGYVICQKLKSNSITKDIPIVFLTVKDEEKDIIKGFECGGVDYVTKPFNPAILLKRVQTHIALSETTKTLKELNENLEQQVTEKISEIRRQDHLMFQQSKMASMGEMIGNIAHQWRQPLGAISSTILTLKTKLDADQTMCNNPETMNTFISHTKEKLDDINEYVATLSSTIDDFRNFFRPTKNKNSFDIQSLVTKSLKLLNANLQECDITIVNNVSKTELNGLENELAQVIINILNNAQEAILQSQNTRVIMITSTQNNDSLTLTVQDSGGGVQENILDKIFEPYFTTKHQTSGTGIGLFMSKEIIEKHMQGRITVKNEHFTYNDENLYGASFTIEIPTT